jgi:hypothetical protein
MYISARQIERDIRLYKHDQIEDAIRETAQTILDQLKDYLNLTPGRVDTNSITIEKIFESEDEDDITNAEKLQYLIDNVYEIIKKLDVDEIIIIETLDDPAYCIKISKYDDDVIDVLAYSNLDDNGFWDEIIEWFE